jgi:Na+-translocating ferredoxin:NAD+ oxidoreductase subunit B
MLAALLLLSALAIAVGAALGYAARRLTGEPVALDDLIDHLLPQTQCGMCGYAGCKPYARAIAAGDADIDRCPPGGNELVSRLADLLRVEPKALDQRYGAARPGHIAVIDESVCIGCTLCLPPCPVDAIVGAAKQAHTVLASVCTGCGLCVEPCPVDCIRMTPSEPALRDWKWSYPAAAPSSASVLPSQFEAV